MAVAAARLYGLDAAGIGHALGIATSMGAGIIEANRAGGSVKRLHCGWAAHAGIVAAQCARAGLPMPKLYLLPEEAPNAFATGRNPRHAAVAVTRGIVRILSEEELEGVLAHELAHVKNRDILIGTIAATLAGAVVVWFVRG